MPGRLARRCSVSSSPDSACLDRRRWLMSTAVGSAGALLTAHVGVAAAAAEVPWLAEIQTPPAQVPDKAPRLGSLLVDSHGQTITSREGWQRRRAELGAAWRDILGNLPLDPDHCPPLKVLEEDRVDNVLRQRVEYEIEPGIKTEAYLARPVQLQQPAPGVAVFHSTVNHSILQPVGLGPDVQKAFALKLARRGCVTISPRNYLWPTNDRIEAESEAKKFLARHPRATGMAKMLYDSRVAVNILAAQPGVDSQRLGCVGHSLGAKEVVYLAAFDERMRVTVSSEGGIGVRFSNWNASWYLGKQVDQPSFTRDHHELLGLIAPRPFLLIGGNSADGDQGWPFIERALEVYRLYGGTPRIGQYNHRQGHAVPPESERRIDEWFATYLLGTGPGAS